MDKLVLATVAVALVACGSSSTGAGTGAPDGGPALGDASPVDASSPADAYTAPVDGDTPLTPDGGPPPPASCAFDLLGQASVMVTGGAATAAVHGEVPFILLDCAGTVGGQVYDFSAQYTGGSGFDLAWVELSTSPYGIAYDTGPCSVSAMVGGVSYPDHAAPLLSGESVDVTFDCPLASGSAFGATGHITATVP